MQERLVGALLPIKRHYLNKTRKGTLMRKRISDTITSLPPSRDRECVFTLLDISTSMESPGYMAGQSNLGVVAKALEAYINILCNNGSDDHLALITFESEANLLSNPLAVGENVLKLREIVRSLPKLAGGGTSMVTGLKLVQKQIAHRRVTELGRLRCIAYSDGHDQNIRSGVAAANLLKKAGVHIQTLGLGEHPSDVDETFLRKVATTDADGTHYRFLKNVESLNTTFRALAEGRLIVE